MLATIVDEAHRRARVAAREVARHRELAAGRPPARPLHAALRGPGLGVIAEVKRRSPSAGPLAPNLDAATQAARYATGGAVAISVLTEPTFFDGSLADLAAVATAVELPVLRKDFIVDEAQIVEARGAGADAVLLIVAILDAARLGGLLAVAGETGMDALVEVHDEDELDVALSAGATIVGVNNRDLVTFVTDLGVAERLARHLPAEVVRVAESGVSSPAGAARMRAAGYDAILVGEAAVRAADPAAFVGRLVASVAR